MPKSLKIGAVSVDETIMDSSSAQPDRPATPRMGSPARIAFGAALLAAVTLLLLALMPIAAADERSTASDGPDVALTTPGPDDEVESGEPEGPAAPIVEEPQLSEPVVVEPVTASEPVAAEKDPPSDAGPPDRREEKPKPDAEHERSADRESAEVEASALEEDEKDEKDEEDAAPAQGAVAESSSDGSLAESEPLPAPAIESATSDGQPESGTAAAAGDAAPDQDGVAESGAPAAIDDEPSPSGAPAESSVSGSQPAGGTGTNEIAIVNGPTDETSELAAGPVPGGAAPAQVGIDLLEGVAGEADVGAALGIPLALLVGVVLFLFVESRTGSHAPKLSQAPRRSRGTARFSDIGE
jgi:hypothetical protein